MEIFVYTVEHKELLKSIFERFEDNAECAASALSIAACKLDNKLGFANTKAVFADFLQENNHLYFDGFVRICL